MFDRAQNISTRFLKERNKLFVILTAVLMAETSLKYWNPQSCPHMMKRIKAIKNLWVFYGIYLSYMKCAYRNKWMITS